MISHAGSEWNTIPIVEIHLPCSLRRCLAPGILLLKLNLKEVTMTVTVDQLVDEYTGIDTFTPPAEKLINLNFALRVALGYLTPHYDESPDISAASDTLAKVIYDLEGEV